MHLNELVVFYQSSVDHRFLTEPKMSSVHCENPAKRAKIEITSEADTSKVQVNEDGHIVCNPGQLFGPYKIDKTIGEGSFGRVAHATNTISGKNVAVKIMKIDREKRKVALAEVCALTLISCRDPYDESLCIKMLDYIISDTYSCIVFPVLGPSVFDFLKENNFESYPMNQIIHISHQLCHAVNFLHRNGMTHTDLKPENVLFVNPSYTKFYDSENKCEIMRLNSSDIRLIDFGLLTRDEDHHNPVISTRYYRAPEVILQLGWSHPCDVWSIGCILVEIYFGHLLFDSEDERQHLAIMEKTLGPIPSEMTKATKTKHFINGTLDWSWKGWEGIEKEISKYYMPLKSYKLVDLDDDDKLFDLIEKMLKYEPTKRILLCDALTHPLFNKLPKHQRVDNAD